MITWLHEVIEGYAMWLKGTHACRHVHITHGSILIFRVMYMSQGRAHIQGALVIHMVVIVTKVKKKLQWKSFHHYWLLSMEKKNLRYKETSNCFHFHAWDSSWSCPFPLPTSSSAASHIILVHFILFPLSSPIMLPSLFLFCHVISFVPLVDNGKKKLGRFLFCFLPDYKTYVRTQKQCWVVLILLSSELIIY